MRYVELFAGAGGLSMGLEAAGMHPVAHAEIEPHARAVLRHHWPETPLHGDVTQVDWTQYAGQVGLVAGGSPCQDLSVAGKRAGLAGARSGLFFELIRAWEETGAPYCLWENVDGARSSNGGEDFAAVLSAFVGNPVAVPRDKRGHARWPGAGVAAGSAGVAAWRVLDLQHFGPPQRRRRVFVLAARTGGCDPAEVLAISEGVCGHPAPREQQGQGTARGAAGGAGGSGAIGVAVNISDAAPQLQDVFATLQSRTGSGGIGSGAQMQAVLAYPIDTRNATRTTEKSEQNRQGVGVGDAGDPSPTLTGLFTPAVAVLAFTTTQTPKVGGDVALTLEAASRSGGGQTPAVLAFDTTQITSAANYSNPKPGDPCHPLAAGAHPPAVLAFQNTGQGWWNESDVAQTLRTPGGGTLANVLSFQQSSLAGRGTMGVDEDTAVLRPVRPQPDHQMLCLASGQANAEVVRDGVPTLNTIHEQPIIAGTSSSGRPRRLTPLECERLMGWPDRHTAQGVKEDGTAYALSDTARYRLCGNGVGAPVAAWIGQRLMAAEASCPR